MMYPNKCADMLAIAWSMLDGEIEYRKGNFESVAYQTHDLLEAMKKDWGDAHEQTVLRVDGGMVASNFAMQRLADLLAAPVDRPVVRETTALGAAYPDPGQPLAQVGHELAHGGGVVCVSDTTPG